MLCLCGLFDYRLTINHRSFYVYIIDSEKDANIAMLIFYTV